MTQFTGETQSQLSVPERFQKRIETSLTEVVDDDGNGTANARGSLQINFPPDNLPVKNLPPITSVVFHRTEMLDDVEADADEAIDYVVTDIEWDEVDEPGGYLEASSDEPAYGSETATITTWECEFYSGAKSQLSVVLNEHGFFEYLDPETDDWVGMRAAQVALLLDDFDRLAGPPSEEPRQMVEAALGGAATAHS